MPFIPHTQNDERDMLDVIGVANIDALFDEIPADILSADISDMPSGVDEKTMMREMRSRAPVDHLGGNFIGAGAYEHYIPAAVWDIATRGEFYTAYTPYQPEVSQGTLQVIYEYQSMITALMKMDVSNASMYDGASALTEAVLMALRLKRNKLHKILVPENLHPHYREVLDTVLKEHDVEQVRWRYDETTGTLNIDQLNAIADNEYAAVILSQPNFFGGIETVDQITNITHEKNALLIGVVNPLAMSLLVPPGQWGETGADIVCGEGQPLGVPLSGGGPYFGFMCCRQKDVRQMPGRIVGKTHDAAGNAGYVLTLQAREQHIRRAKATSNICTNQGLMVTAATIYMRLLGLSGMRKVALESHQKAMALRAELVKLDGVSLVFNTPSFHEFVIEVDQPLDRVLAKLQKQDICAGLSLLRYYPSLNNALLVCVTETKTDADISNYCQLLAKVL